MTNNIRKPIRMGNVRNFGDEVARAARRNRINLNRPVHTFEGDDVVILATDKGHPFPIVGEVLDFNSGVAWLGRWSLSGRYQGTEAAQSKHSIMPNILSNGMPVDIIRNSRPPQPTGAPVVNGPLREAEVPFFLRRTADTRDPIAAPEANEREFDRAFEEAVSKTNTENPFLPIIYAALHTHPFQHIMAIGGRATALWALGRLVVQPGVKLDGLDLPALEKIVNAASEHPRARVTITGVTRRSLDDVIDSEGIPPELRRGLRFGEHDPRPTFSGYPERGTDA
jgi:hypothetical protein